MQLTHDFTDYSRTLYVALIGAKTHIEHLVQDATLHWL
jgi:hypothetical protein